MSEEAPTANQLAWCSSFIASHFDPYDKPPTFDELRNRIEKNRGNKINLSPQDLVWNQKTRPLKRWDNMLQGHFDGPADNSWNKDGKDGCLAIPRHRKYDYTLNRADYVKNVKNIDCIDSGTIYFKKGRERSGLFWLITASEAPFVYSILKSSMFKAWCGLTANTEGDSHFTEGMWNTFPLPSLTDDQKESIIKAGKNRQNPDKILDALLNLPCNATDEERKNMLADGFLKTFQDV